MANELDDYLNQQEQQKQKQAAEESAKYAAEEKKIDAFNNAYKDLRDTLIYPTMAALLDNLRKHGASASVHDVNMKDNYHHRSYYIAKDKGNSRYGIISVVGNYHKQKVCVGTEFFGGHPIACTSYHKTEQQYNVTEITPALLDTLVVNTLKQLATETK